MSVIWYKVWSDLWHNKVRTSLAVLSIAVGVFAIGAIFGMSDQLLTGMDAAHQAIIPAHIRIFLRDGVDRATADRLEHISGVEAIELVQNMTVRYKLNPADPWQTGSITARADYNQMKYELVQLKAGEWPDKKRLAVERLSSQYFGIGMGDKVIFELGDSDRVLSVEGVVRNPFVQPPLFGGNAAFFIGAGGLERFGIPPDKFGQMLIRVTPYSPELAEKVASQIKDDLAKEGVDVVTTFYQNPTEHWGRRFVVSQVVIMQILAVVSLFMSVVLVLNTMTALITQQTNQIGIIKAIGGTTYQIIKIYLVGALVYGLLALLISLPLGAFLAYGLTKNFLNLFNIDYETFHVSSQALIWQVLAAIVAPLLAALWPVLTGAFITVRQAMASYGLGGGGHFGQSAFDRLVERLGQRFLPGPYAMAWGNMFRRKPRLAFTQLVLMSAGVMFLVVMSLSASIRLTMDNFLARRAYDLEIVFKNPERIDRALRIAELVQGVETAEVWFRQPAAIFKQGQRTREAGIGAFMYGLPLKNEMFQPLMVAGRWLQPGDGQVMVISEETAQKNAIKVGDMVTVELGQLGKADWQVVGIFQTVFGGGFNVDPIYAPQDAIFSATTKHGVGSFLYVRTRSPQPGYVDAVDTELKALYKREKMEVVSSQTSAKFRDSTNNQFNITINMLLAVAIIVAAVGGMGLTGALSISVVERIKEIGVMRAIGARSGLIMGMFVLEGMLQGLVSWVAALPLSLLLAPPLTGVLGNALKVKLDYQYNFQAVLTWFIVILVISALASLMPARHATRVSVQQSLAYA
jgi:putative ABC transport system permease protein